MTMMLSSLLEAARRTYEAAATLRDRRQRFKNFTYGSQWGDIVTDPHGNRLTEGELAARSGRVPLTNNMIRQLVKTIVGRFRLSLDGEKSADSVVAEIASRNELDELDARLLEEFLISGCAVQRIVREPRRGGESAVWVDNVNPSVFFAAPLSDPRVTDVEIAGRLSDMNLPEVIGRFANGSTRRADELRRIYASAEAAERTFALAALHGGSTDFFRASEGRCRVIEVWTLDARERLRIDDPLNNTTFLVTPDKERWVADTNRRRARRGFQRLTATHELTTLWCGRYLAPTGELLGETEADMHPFVMRFYPLTDGEIHPFVEDVIDQQKYVNRIITLADNVMASSAKGVLLFPEDQVSDSMNWSDVREAWAAYDGIIPYRPRPGMPGPQQVVSSGGNFGAYDLLQMELKMFERVSGVTDAYRGNAIGGNQSAQLYEAQLRSSEAAVADLFATFNSFRLVRNRRLVSL